MEADILHMDRKGPASLGKMRLQPQKLPTPERPKHAKVTGKNLALIKHQAAEATGRPISEFEGPEEEPSQSTATFASSLYGMERGSTKVWGGKGRGKGGK